MQAPSNKVGFILLIVVLVVTGTITLSKIDTSSRKSTSPEADVNLIIEKKISDQYKTEMGEEHPLWLEELYRTQLSGGVRKSTDFDPNAFSPGSVTEQMSIDLFTEYLLKRQDGFLNPEDEREIARKVAEKTVQNANFEMNKYSIKDLNIVQSTPLTVSVYGDRLAQVVIDNLIKMDNLKNLQGTSYIKAIANIHKDYLVEMLSISVPDVVQDVHVELVNGVYNTGVLFDVLSSDIEDPVVALTLITQYQVIETNDVELYTLLAQYFENNGIIFDAESTVRFWAMFN